MKDEASNLYVESDGEGGWDVYFKIPFGGREVLDSFRTIEEAIEYAEEQLATADLSECDGEGELIVVEDPPFDWVI